MEGEGRILGVRVSASARAQPQGLGQGSGERLRTSRAPTSAALRSAAVGLRRVCRVGGGADGGERAIAPRHTVVVHASEVVVHASEAVVHASERAIAPRRLDRRALHLTSRSSVRSSVRSRVRSSISMRSSLLAYKAHQHAELISMQPAVRRSSACNRPSGASMDAQCLVSRSSGDR